MASGETTTYAIAVASLGEYRIRTMQMVQQRLGGRLRIHAGVQPAEAAVRVATRHDIEMTELRNVYLPGGVLLQVLPTSALFADTLLLDLNPRVLLSWPLLLLRRLLGKRTVLWGHAFPRAGRGARSEPLRRAMRRLADGLLTYTRTQGEELRQLHPDKPIFTAPNALYRRDEMRFDAAGAHLDIVYVGRLVAGKKPELLLAAFELAADRLPPESKLVIVGDGPLAGELRARAASSRHAGRMQLLGHVSDHARLEAIYRDALVSVSPGYVGLSITQSFSFGVPMLISRDEPHSPEIEAVVEGENAAFFATDDPQALATALLDAARDRAEWRARGAAIVAACAASYSVEAMANGIVAALVGDGR